MGADSPGRNECPMQGANVRGPDAKGRTRHSPSTPQPGQMGGRQGLGALQGARGNLGVKECPVPLLQWWLRELYAFVRTHKTIH